MATGVASEIEDRAEVRPVCPDARLSDEVVGEG